MHTGTIKTLCGVKCYNFSMHVTWYRIISVFFSFVIFWSKSKLFLKTTHYACNITFVKPLLSIIIFRCNKWSWTFICRSNTSIYCLYLRSRSVPSCWILRWVHEEESRHCNRMRGKTVQKLDSAKTTTSLFLAFLDKSI